MLKKIENNLREFVYGGTDGAVTTFAVVTGAAGANLGTSVILILGFANVFADGFSMAVGSYLSEKSDQDLQVKQGTPLKADKNHKTALTASIATFISFILVGFIPLSVYTIDFVFDMGLATQDALIMSVLLTLTAFAIIGYLRGFVTGINRSKTTLETLGLGLAAAVISYLVGNFLEKLIK